MTSSDGQTGITRILGVQS